MTATCQKNHSSFINMSSSISSFIGDPLPKCPKNGTIECKQTTCPYIKPFMLTLVSSSKQPALTPLHKMVLQKESTTCYLTLLTDYSKRCMWPNIIMTTIDLHNDFLSSPLGGAIPLCHLFHDASLFTLPPYVSECTTFLLHHKLSLSKFLLGC